VRTKAALLVVLLGATVAACNALAGIRRATEGASDASTNPTSDASAPKPGDCGLAAPAFCEDLEGIVPGNVPKGKRAGQLDDARWSVARLGPTNSGQGMFDEWPPVDARFCGSVRSGVLPDNDVVVCKDASGGSNLLADAIAASRGHLAMRVRQPFDFGGRIATIAFDVDAVGDLDGSPSVWIADEAVPVPFQRSDQIETVARNAIGFEFGGGGGCPSGANTLTDVSVFANRASVAVSDIQSDCFLVEPGVLNHIEIRLGQPATEVWASDARSRSSLRRIARVLDVPMPFTRGYVSFEHAQANTPRTYHWDNLGFDGPTLPQPQGRSAPDSLEARSDGVNLGYTMSDTQLFDFAGLDPSGATSAHLDLNAWLISNPETFTLSFNGGPRRPFTTPVAEGTDARTLSIPVELGDLKAGDNYLELRAASTDTVIANVDLTLEVAQ
jgi:hypothetical protein